ncbi:hypothetical protein J437_LFUL010629 [Ladona fulva]|uniref:Uncharacterized protein n=1 Tax=Ladona fulva TaxID=123851 RepID=A0A8K0P209_LADFU|nr:hypothetical protein J437_LFUL010629 [Ladona fulva]
MKEVLKGLLEVVVFLLLCIYYTVEASIRFLLVPIRLRVKSVAGEVALITGGGSGIGRLIAVKLAGKGATVVLWDINLAGKCLGEMLLLAFEDVPRSGRRYNRVFGRKHGVHYCCSG